MEEKTNRTKPSGWILVLASLAAGVLLAGLGFLLFPWGHRPAAGSPVTDDLAAEPAIPLIDEVTPRNIETATFALG